MKFLIQKINNEIVHDFSFTLVESIKYMNWYTLSKDYKVKFMDSGHNPYEDKSYINFNNSLLYKQYTPIGSVNFVTLYLQQFYGKTPKPINVPMELFGFACRNIWNGTEKDLNISVYNEVFVKSNDKIKAFTEIIK